MYTVSKGHISIIFKWSDDLGSDVHVTAVEMEDAYKVCNLIKSSFGSNIASISVDNAANHGAAAVASKLPILLIVLISSSKT